MAFHFYGGTVNISLADFALKDNDFEKLSLQYWAFLFFLHVFVFVNGYIYNNNN